MVSFQFERVQFEFVGDCHLRGLLKTDPLLERAEGQASAVHDQSHRGPLWIHYHGDQFRSGSLGRRYRIIYAAHLRYFGTTVRGLHNGAVDSVHQLEGKKLILYSPDHLLERVSLELPLSK